MTHHTPEPWTLSDAKNAAGVILGGPSRSLHTGTTVQSQIASACLQEWMTSGERDANARRIVACVNACAGWETNQLEAMELGSLKESLVRVMEQRDHLLDALHDAATSLETIQLRSFGEDSFLDSKPEMRSYAGSRAAVARESIDKAIAMASAAIKKITGETK